MGTTETYSLKMQTCQTGNSDHSTSCCQVNNCLNCTLRKIHNQILTPQQSDYLDANRIEVSFKKGENICKQGTRASSIICIKEGLAKMYVEDGSDYSTLLLKKQCDMIGLQSLFTNGILQYSAEALSDIQACFVDIQTIENLFSENVDCAKEMMQYVNKDMITMFDKVYSFSTKHIHGRLAELLLYLHKNIYGTNPFKLTLSKTDLSEILGTSKESVSRMFKELKQDKILKESHHTIEILDFARLKMISHTG